MSSAFPPGIFQITNYGKKEEILLFKGLDGDNDPTFSTAGYSPTWFYFGGGGLILCSNDAFKHTDRIHYFGIAEEGKYPYAAWDANLDHAKYKWSYDPKDNSIRNQYSGARYNIVFKTDTLK